MSTSALALLAGRLSQAVSVSLQSLTADLPLGPVLARAGVPLDSAQTITGVRAFVGGERAVEERPLDALSAPFGELVRLELTTQVTLFGAQATGIWSFTREGLVALRFVWTDPAGLSPATLLAQRGASLGGLLGDRGRALRAGLGGAELSALSLAVDTHTSDWTIDAEGQATLLGQPRRVSLVVQVARPFDRTGVRIALTVADGLELEALVAELGIDLSAVRELLPSPSVAFRHLVIDQMGGSLSLGGPVTGATWERDLRVELARGGLQIELGRFYGEEAPEPSWPDLTELASVVPVAFAGAELLPAALRGALPALLGWLERVRVREARLILDPSTRSLSASGAALLELNEAQPVHTSLSIDPVIQEGARVGWSLRFATIEAHLQLTALLRLLLSPSGELDLGARLPELEVGLREARVITGGRERGVLLDLDVEIAGVAAAMRMEVRAPTGGAALSTTLALWLGGVGFDLSAQGDGALEASLKEGSSLSVDGLTSALGLDLDALLHEPLADATLSLGDALSRFGFAVHALAATQLRAARFSHRPGTKDLALALTLGPPEDSGAFGAFALGELGEIALQSLTLSVRRRGGALGEARVEASLQVALEGGDPTELRAAVEATGDAALGITFEVAVAGLDLDVALRYGEGPSGDRARSLAADLKVGSSVLNLSFAASGSSTTATARLGEGTTLVGLLDEIPAPAGGDPVRVPAALAAAINALPTPAIEVALGEQTRVSITADATALTLWRLKAGWFARVEVKGATLPPDLDVPPAFGEILRDTRFVWVPRPLPEGTWDAGDGPEVHGLAIVTALPVHETPVGRAIGIEREVPVVLEDGRLSIALDVDLLRGSPLVLFDGVSFHALRFWYRSRAQVGLTAACDLTLPFPGTPTLRLAGGVSADLEAAAVSFELALSGQVVDGALRPTWEAPFGFKALQVDELAVAIGPTSRAFLGSLRLRNTQLSVSAMTAGEAYGVTVYARRLTLQDVLDALAPDLGALPSFLGSAGFEELEAQSANRALSHTFANGQQRSWSPGLSGRGVLEILGLRFQASVDLSKGELEGSTAVIQFPPEDVDGVPAGRLFRLSAPSGAGGPEIRVKARDGEARLLGALSVLGQARDVDAVIDSRGVVLHLGSGLDSGALQWDTSIDVTLKLGSEYPSLDLAATFSASFDFDPRERLKDEVGLDLALLDLAKIPIGFSMRVEAVVRSEAVSGSLTLSFTLWGRHFDIQLGVAVDRFDPATLTTLATEHLGDAALEMAKNVGGMILVVLEEVVQRVLGVLKELGEQVLRAFEAIRAAIEAVEKAFEALGELLEEAGAELLSWFGEDGPKRALEAEKREDLRRARAVEDAARARARETERRQYAQLVELIEHQAEAALDDDGLRAAIEDRIKQYDEQLINPFTGEADFRADNSDGYRRLWGEAIDRAEVRRQLIADYEAALREGRLKLDQLKRDRQEARDELGAIEARLKGLTTRKTEVETALNGLQTARKKALDAQWLANGGAARVEAALYQVDELETILKTDHTYLSDLSAEITTLRSWGRDDLFAQARARLKHLLSEADAELETATIDLKRAREAASRAEERVVEVELALRSFTITRLALVREAASTTLGAEETFQTWIELCDRAGGADRVRLQGELQERALALLGSLPASLARAAASEAREAEQLVASLIEAEPVPRLASLWEFNPLDELRPVGDWDRRARGEAISLWVKGPITNGQALLGILAAPATPDFEARVESWLCDAHLLNTISLRFPELSSGWEPTVERGLVGVAELEADIVEAGSVYRLGRARALANDKLVEELQSQLAELKAQAFRERGAALWTLIGDHVDVFKDVESAVESVMEDVELTWRRVENWAYQVTRTHVQGGVVKPEDAARVAELRESWRVSLDSLGDQKQSLNLQASLYATPRSRAGRSLDDAKRIREGAAPDSFVRQAIRILGELRDRDLGDLGVTGLKQVFEDAASLKTAVTTFSTAVADFIDHQRELYSLQSLTVLIDDNVREDEAVSAEQPRSLSMAHERLRDGRSFEALSGAETTWKGLQHNAIQSWGAVKAEVEQEIEAQHLSLLPDEQARAQAHAEERAALARSNDLKSSLNQRMDRLQDAMGAWFNHRSWSRGSEVLLPLIISAMRHGDRSSAITWTMADRRGLRDDRQDRAREHLEGLPAVAAPRARAASAVVLPVSLGPEHLARVERWSRLLDGLRTQALTLAADLDSAATGHRDARARSLRGWAEDLGAALLAEAVERLRAARLRRLSVIEQASVVLKEAERLLGEGQLSALLESLRGLRASAAEALAGVRKGFDTKLQEAKVVAPEDDSGPIADARALLRSAELATRDVSATTSLLGDLIEQLPSTPRAVALMNPAGAPSSVLRAALQSVQDETRRVEQWTSALKQGMATLGTHKDRLLALTEGGDAVATDFPSVLTALQDGTRSWEDAGVAASSALGELARELEAVVALIRSTEETHRSLVVEHMALARLRVHYGWACAHEALEGERVEAMLATPLRSEDRLDHDLLGALRATVESSLGSFALARSQWQQSAADLAASLIRRRARLALEDLAYGERLEDWRLDWLAQRAQRQKDHVTHGQDREENNPWLLERLTTDGALSLLRAEPGANGFLTSTVDARVGTSFDVYLMGVGGEGDDRLLIRSSLTGQTLRIYPCPQLAPEESRNRATSDDSVPVAVTGQDLPDWLFEIEGVLYYRAGEDLPGKLMFELEVTGAGDGSLVSWWTGGNIYSVILEDGYARVVSRGRGFVEKDFVWVSSALQRRGEGLTRVLVTYTHNGSSVTLEEMEAPGGSAAKGGGLALVTLKVSNGFWDGTDPSVVGEWSPPAGLGLPLPALTDSWNVSRGHPIPGESASRSSRVALRRQVAGAPRAGVLAPRLRAQLLNLPDRPRSYRLGEDVDGRWCWLGWSEHGFVATWDPREACAIALRARVPEPDETERAWFDALRAAWQEQVGERERWLMRRYEAARLSRLWLARAGWSLTLRHRERDATREALEALRLRVAIRRSQVRLDAEATAEIRVPVDLDDAPIAGFSLSFWLRQVDASSGVLAALVPLQGEAPLLCSREAEGFGLRYGALWAVLPADLPEGWCHIALTVRPTGFVQLFVDGVRRSVGRLGDHPQLPRVAALRLGAASGELARSLEGTLEQVALWRGVRHAAEIRDEQSDGLSGREQALVAVACPGGSDPGDAPGASELFWSNCARGGTDFVGSRRPLPPGVAVYDTPVLQRVESWLEHLDRVRHSAWPDVALVQRLLSKGDRRGRGSSRLRRALSAASARPTRAALTWSIDTWRRALQSWQPDRAVTAAGFLAECRRVGVEPSPIHPLAGDHEGLVASLASAPESRAQSLRDHGWTPGVLDEPALAALSEQALRRALDRNDTPAERERALRLLGLEPALGALPDPVLHRRDALDRALQTLDPEAPSGIQREHELTWIRLEQALLLPLLEHAGDSWMVQAMRDGLVHDVERELLTPDPGYRPSWSRFEPSFIREVSLASRS